MVSNPLQVFIQFGNIFLIVSQNAQWIARTQVITKVNNEIVAIPFQQAFDSQ